MQSIENILYSNYIKYETMYALTMRAFHGSTAENVDVYIDMNSFLSRLFTIPDLEIRNYTVITSSVINLCAHIREYFWSRHRVWSRIFIVYGDNFPNRQRVINPTYNQHNYDAWVTHGLYRQLIADNVSILDMLCPYICDVFFVHKDCEETGVIMHTLMQKMLPSRASSGMYPNIIFTRDPYLYQLVGMERETFIYRPKKYNGVDLSWVVTKKNLFENFAIGELKNKWTTVDHNYDYVNREIFPAILALSGLKCRNINSIIQFRKALELFAVAVGNGDIPNQYIADLGYVISIFLDANTDKKYRGVSIPVGKIDEFINRYEQIDIIRNPMRYEDAVSIDSALVNLSDPEAIKEINNRYFVNNPLDLNGL